MRTYNVLKIFRNYTRKISLHNHARQLTMQKAKLEQKPLDPKLHYNLGDIFFSMNNYHIAVAEYRTSLALGRTEPDVKFDLAKAYIAL